MDFSKREFKLRCRESLTKSLEDENGIILE